MALERGLWLQVPSNLSQNNSLEQANKRPNDVNVHDIIPSTRKRLTLNTNSGTVEE